MKKLYIVKSFGRYHYFKTEDDRIAYLKTLADWEAKKAEQYEVGGDE